jgi:hypothetical protein
MRKLIAIVVIATLAACGSGASTEVTTDSTATVSTDTTAVVADSTAQTTDSVVVK